jgi:hypothetical protein
MKLSFIIATVLGLAALSGCTTNRPEMMGNLQQELNPESFYLPNACVRQNSSVLGSKG